MYSGSVNGAFGIVGTQRRHPHQLLRLPYGNPRTSTALTTENTAVVAPIAMASVSITVSANPAPRVLPQRNPNVVEEWCP